MSLTIAKILGTRTHHVCESCGVKAQVQLSDHSTWCRECDGAARKDGF